MGNIRSNEWKNKIYQNWRKSVFERDGHKCLHCGNNKYLHAHHIEPYFRCPEKRYDVHNGQTLCRSCHTRHENTGKKASIETRLKMRESRLGYVVPEEVRKKISKSHKGMSPSQEIRDRISKKLIGNKAWNRGIKHTEEHKQALRGKRSHVIAWNRGIPLTDEVKKKLSDSLKGKRGPNTGKKMSQESIDKMKATKKRQFEMKKQGLI
jgi:hypothetical protein